MTMASELLDAALQRDADVLDEKLFLETVVGARAPQRTAVSEPRRTR
jgi:hypothetical protein